MTLTDPDLIPTCCGEHMLTETGSDQVSCADWLRVDIERVLEAIAADEAVEDALVDTGWADDTQPGEPERLRQAANEIRSAFP